MLNDEKMPALFQVADKASKNAQNYYVQSMKINLLLIVLAGLLGAFSLETTTDKKIAAFVAAIFLLSSLILTIIIQLIKWEDVWYEGRAVAESAKTLAWRYATCAEPFLSTLPESKVDTELRKNLNLLLQGKERLASFIQGKDVQRQYISDEMRQLRKESFKDRLDVYVNHRIKTQQEWYTNKAAFNAKWENVWFAIIIISQIGAVISAVYMIFNPKLNINLTGFFGALAAAGVAWLQLKRYQELTRSYNITALELGMVIDQSREIISEQALSVYVGDSENAISREHTLWLARRDKFSQTPK
jgi:hypothetical protein